MEGSKTRFSIALPTYGDDSVEELIAHYGEDKDAETVDGEEAMISTEILTRWKTFRQLLATMGYYCNTAERTCFQ